MEGGHGRPPRLPPLTNYSLIVESVLSQANQISYHWESWSESWKSGMKKPKMDYQGGGYQ